MTLIQHRHPEEAAIIADHALWARRTAAHGQACVDTISLMGVLGAALSAQGKHVEAELHHAAALKMASAFHGENHVTTRVAKHSLLMTLIAQSKHAEADALRGTPATAPASYGSALVVASA